jgi:hypothetical protein
MLENRREISRKLLELSTEDLNHVVDFHSYSMTIVWLFFAIVGLWAHAFKQYRLSKFVHGISMSVLILITFTSGIFAMIFMDEVELVD